MFFRAIFKNELIFRGRRIRGRLAQILGVIGMLGITAGGYLVIGLKVFHTEPPFIPVAVILFALFVFMSFVLRLWSIF